MSQTTTRRSTETGTGDASSDHEAASTVAAPASKPIDRRLQIAAALTGILISSSFLSFRLYAVAWFAFVPLLWALRQAKDRRTVTRLGWIAGLTTNLPAFHWLIYTIHVFGGFPAIIAVFFYSCLSLFTSTQFVLFTLAARRSGRGPLLLAAPAIWVSLEFLFPNLFPWRMANSQYEVPLLLQSGDLFGPFGLSFVIVWFSAAIAQWLPPLEAERETSQQRALPLALAGGAALALALYGHVRLGEIDTLLQASDSVEVALVQGNISIEEKDDQTLIDTNLERYRELSLPLQATTDLVVWPETVSQHWIEADSRTLSVKTNPFPDLKTHLLFGGLAYRLTGPDSADEFNSSFLIGPGGTVHGRYDKRILMPFGEYIPFAWLFPAIRKLSPNTAGFLAGEGVQVWDIGGKFKLGPLICYEDLIAAMPRETTLAGAEVLLNILNDAWYGESAAPVQHQALAIWRSVENRRYLLRGSNTGVTSIIDPAGRIVAEGGLFTEEVIRGRIQPLKLLTFHTRFGDVFAWSVVIGAALLLATARSGRSVSAS